MKYALMFTAAIALSGCVTPESLMPADQARAQQELRLGQYTRLSCSKLRQLHLANRPSLLSVLGTSVLLQQVKQRDMEEAMRRKGCRLPEGVS